MSVFKKLNRQEVFVVPYLSRKLWFGEKSVLDSYGISKKTGISGSIIDLFSGSINYQDQLTYQSIKHLYYSNLSGSVISGSYENYFQSSFDQDTRNIQDNIVVFSYPKGVTGEYIQPKSVSLTFTSSSLSGSIIDNGEGKLILSESNILTGSNINIGDIIYSHGIVSITDPTLVQILDTTTNYTSSWESTLTVYTLHTNCKVKDYEFNFTQNPSALTGSNGELKQNIASSDFRPYITGIGLYNDANELIAVGKFGQAIPKTPHTDMTFVIKLDM
jgi:hypothetical protein